MPHSPLDLNITKSIYMFTWSSLDKTHFLRGLSEPWNQVLYFSPAYSKPISTESLCRIAGSLIFLRLINTERVNRTAMTGELGSSCVFSVEEVILLLSSDCMVRSRSSCLISNSNALDFNAPWIFDGKRSWTKWLLSKRGDQEVLNWGSIEVQWMKTSCVLLTVMVL